MTEEQMRAIDESPSYSSGGRILSFKEQVSPRAQLGEFRSRTPRLQARKARLRLLELTMREETL
jgi:hypothetical protein